MTRWVVLGLGLVACGGGVPGSSQLEVEEDARAESLEVEEMPEPPRVPCYQLDPILDAKWQVQGIHALEYALNRWERVYRPGAAGEQCELNIIAVDANHPFIVGFPDCEHACGNPEVIRVRSDVSTVMAGERCFPDQYLLSDVLTHELGHFFGLRHSEWTWEHRNAMGHPTPPCTRLIPTDEELLAAECSGWNQAPDAGCP